MIVSRPWSCQPFGDKTTPENFTNIVSEKDEIIIATNVHKEEAEFIVKAVNQYSIMKNIWYIAFVTYGTFDLTRQVIQ